MAGIYLHIPFCQQRCRYCDFFSTTRLNKTDQFVEALCHELEQQSHYLSNQPIDTVYFGGGTPSVLTANHLARIFATITTHYQLNTGAEITLEANPDDLSLTYINQLAKSPINRLSIGIQSFANHHLQLMNRRHNVQQAVEAVVNAQQAGFNNISIDLIYGLPNMDTELWQQNLRQAAQLNIQHLSAYHLTYEPHTAFMAMLKKKQLGTLPTEEDSIVQFEQLMNWAKTNGFEHYEISNFARPHYHSRHNTAYWQQIPYLGVGPSAHSYNGLSRCWNAPDLNQYLQNPLPPHYRTTEILTPTQQINEYLMTHLRTMWGVNLTHLQNQLTAKQNQHLTKTINTYCNTGKAVVENNVLRLTQQGFFVCDAILTDLILDEPT